MRCYNPGMTTLFCPAKVNLYLAILGCDPGGYHEIDTVFARVPELADTIDLEPAAELQLEFVQNDRLETHASGGIEPENNTVLHALRLLEAHTGRQFPYKITVHKNIPLQSGLGGASSDAAAILLYLNDAEKLGLSDAELTRLGAQIGMDVPFFLSGHPVARGTHYGEKITHLPSLTEKITIGFTNIPISTKEAFAEWDRRGLTSTAPEFSSDVIHNLHNDFEQIFPDLSFKKSNTVLSGSGGAYAILT